MKKYMVMECHPSYAVVLGDDGRFLKVANFNYEVGQTVTDVVEMQIPQSVPKKKNNKRWLYSLAAMAACLLLIVTSVFRMWQTPCASVYLSINPEVRIDVNRRDIVVGLDGVNEDGDNLIEGYDYKKKELNLVMDELVDRAIDMGYLHEGGRISLVLDADSDEWVVSHTESLANLLDNHLSEKLTVTIYINGKVMQNNKFVIPVIPNDDDGGYDYGYYDDGDDDEYDDD
jgi:hypothetical protein